MCPRLAANHKISVSARNAYEGRIGAYLDYGALNRYFVKLRNMNPSLVCLQFMGDIFHGNVLAYHRKLIFDLLRRLDGRHIFLILTKRPENISVEIPPNCWLGVSGHDGMSAYNRMSLVHEMGLAVGRRWLSLEPFLGMRKVGMPVGEMCATFGFGWVACGPETGAGRRRYPHGNGFVGIADIAESCGDFGVAFYDKRSLTPKEIMAGISRRREYPQNFMVRLGGKNASTSEKKA